MTLAVDGSSSLIVSAPRKVRILAILVLRRALASRPLWRMRWKPFGNTWIRKRRMNSYPWSCAHEEVSLVWNLGGSWENALATEAKSPRSTAHSRPLNPRDTFLFSTTPAKSATIAERFSTWALSDRCCKKDTHSTYHSLSFAQ